MTTPPNFRDHRIYLVHLLRELQGRGAVAPSSIYDAVADRAGVTEKQRLLTSEKDDAIIYKNRIQFARQSLVDAGLLIGSSDPGWQRGRWRLNAVGEELASSTSDDTKLDQVVQTRAAEGARERALARRKSRALAGLDSESGDDLGSTVEVDSASEISQEPALEIAHLVETENALAKARMLDHLRAMNETAFERLVGDVLKAALRAESVLITRKSRDGGIDGVLHFDGLQIRIAVFEVKRYGEGNTVGRPLIDAFATAARRHCASHKLFVTSSQFTAEAVEAARGEAVRLIDGVAFVDLMAEYDIGLRPRETFVLYEMDPAWDVPDDGEE